MQCRYKVYVIDECLTGDSLILTDAGLIPIDNPNIQGQRVLSYNESSEKWEFKKVVRWLDQGEKQTLVIKTTHREIKCTSNHLIRTDEGWIAAKNIKEGMKILSPVNVDVALSSTNLGLMDAANSGLRKHLQAAASKHNLRVLFPPLKFCTDNAAMIGCAAAEHLSLGRTSPLTLGVHSRLSLNQVMQLYEN